MTVTVSGAPIGGSYRIYGIANDPSASAPLGRRYFHVGAHWIGFDDNFAEPVVVRAYFDPTQDEKTQDTRDLSYVGYMQFMQMNFRGTPIPPSIYGGILAQRQAYVYGDQMMVDFMDAKSAGLRNILEPFYPWNGMLLTTSIRSVDDLYYQPLPNGSLRAADSNLGPKQSLVASLAAEITASLVDEQVVLSAMGLDDLLSRDDDTLLVKILPAPGQLATTEAYRIALNWLEANPLPGSPSGTPAFLAGLDESQVAAQVVGDYVLLTLPDPEDLGDTLVVSTEPSPSGTQVVVHLLSEYDFVAMSTDAARNALWRIKEYQLGLEMMDLSEEADARPTGRGLSGLTSPPYALSASDFTLELKYWTAAVGVRTFEARRSQRWVMLSCLEWSALFQFDEDTGLMTLAAIREPTLADSFKLRPGIDQYIKAKNAASEDDNISTSNFTKAAMARDNFAAGNKLAFVNEVGSAI